MDNTTYTWMGNPNPLPDVATQTSFAYTSTRSIFEFDVGGKVSLKVRFTSPITPDDLLRQSAPVSYMGLEIMSKDGGEHDVQIYTDVTAGKASGSRTKDLQALKLTDSDQNGHPGIARNKLNGHMVLLVALQELHITGLPARLRPTSARSTIRLSGAIGIMQHPAPIVSLTNRVPTMTCVGNSPATVRLITPTITTTARSMTGILSSPSV